LLDRIVRWRTVDRIYEGELAVDYVEVRFLLKRFPKLREEPVSLGMPMISPGTITGRGAEAMHRLGRILEKRFPIELFLAFG